MLKPSLSENTRFGILFSIIFAIVSLYFLYLNEYLFFISFLFISILILILGIYKPNLLSFFSNSWLLIGKIMGYLISPLILGIMFFFIITPISIFFKIIKRDELKIKNTKALSNWLPRQNKKIEKDSFKDQF